MNKYSNKMESLIIRNATIDDLDTLHLFEQGVIAAERAFDPTLKREDATYYDIREMIHASHIELLVALHEQKIIGCGYARIENAKLYLRHTNHAYLGFMYVDPIFRGRGVNRQIIDSLKKWASGMGVFEIRLEVYYNNLSAIKAYEKVGFERHMIEMRCPTENEQSPGVKSYEVN